jgi:UDP-glucuronate 4-epimerase
MNYTNELFCVLGDCYKEKCHNCFPVKKCSYNHDFCKENGICEEIKEISNTTILVTGSCGFIGFHLTNNLLNLGYKVIGIDNLDNYIYDPSFKKNNQNMLIQNTNYTNIEGNVEDENYILQFNPDIIIHLAAYANVRKSNEDPDKFIRNNVEVTSILLKQIQDMEVKPLFIYASSSSVYGKNTKMPFTETDELNNIVSPYAFSKKMCEDLVSLYCKNYNIKAIGFRFFTVYGPGGRPDMAIYNFVTKIQNEQPIIKYGDGSMERDFTYVDDIVNGIINSIKLKKSMQSGDHKIFNLGNNTPIKLNELINICEEIVGKKAIIIQKDIPVGDVPITYANINKAKKELNYNPTTSIKEGIEHMFQWINILNSK